jgi:hypothetical protein
MASDDGVDWKLSRKSQWKIQSVLSGGPQAGQGRRRANKAEAGRLTLATTCFVSDSAPIATLATEIISIPDRNRRRSRTAQEPLKGFV